MSWQDQLKGDSLSWLLDSSTTGVRYLALRDLLDLPQSDAELITARQAAHANGPIATVLGKMDDAGYWFKPGPGYSPKYLSTVWSLILLAQLGASAEADPRVARACAYLLDHALVEGGKFSYSDSPEGTIDCLQGNLAWALLELGYVDPRLEDAFEWMARSVTGEGVAPLEDKDATLRYYPAKCGANFACRYNGGLPCAWGGVKVLMALGKWRKQGNRELIERAIQRGVDFMFSVDPALAAYPTRDNQTPNRNWWKFGFPVFYVADLLQLVEALVALDYGADPRLQHAISIILDKQDADGRWALEHAYKTWVQLGQLKQPNKWVTLRALRVLKAIDRP